MTSKRRRSRCRDQKYDPIAFTIKGRITKSHEVDGVTIIDEIELDSIGGVPVDLFKNRERFDQVIVGDPSPSDAPVIEPAGRQEP